MNVDTFLYKFSQSLNSLTPRKTRIVFYLTEGVPMNLGSCFVLPLFQIIRRFSFSRYIDFNMYLDIAYIYAYSENYV
jgi:hypothetical protein